jgi:peptidoglycan/LPS O-acetylase OafA/YrhL
MLKFREGKFMLVNLVIIFALIVCATYVVPGYKDNNFYTYATYVIAALLLLMSICQILLARKLFRIAKEYSTVDSKTSVDKE